jgi:hypothetical protein
VVSAKGTALSPKCTLPGFFLWYKFLPELNYYPWHPKSMIRQTSNTPLLIISLMLHIRKPAPTPTPNTLGMITSNPDVLTNTETERDG